MAINKKNKTFGDQKPLNLYLANSEDLGDVPHNAAFDQSLYCLLRQPPSLKEELQYFLEILA